MTDAPEWIDLRKVDDSRWVSATLKGTTTEVELVVLHHDPSSDATVSLVRFPPGLARTELGCYPAAEELAVIDGSLEFAGHTFVRGDYACVPSRVLRTPMSSPDGLLVLAWFSGRPDWLTDESERVPGAVGRLALTPGTLRAPSGELPGRTEVLAAIEPDDLDRDVLDVDGSRWCFVPAGHAVPGCDGPVQVRTWPR